LPKLARDGVLFGVVEHFLREGWSPGQIAGAMKMIWPDAPARRVAAETIDTCRYALLQGAWHQERIASLRKARRARLPRARGTDRRGQLADRLSIHIRPPAGEDCVLPGHWAGDFIQGAGNRSAVGSWSSAARAWSCWPRDGRCHGRLRPGGVYASAQRHRRTVAPIVDLWPGEGDGAPCRADRPDGVKVYCCDPHSPWQRGFCENTNGLLRQYLPKGTDLSVYRQEQRDAIAERLNQRPRAIHATIPPISVYLG
jgi:IS30 family transposase